MNDIKEYIKSNFRHIEKSLKNERELIWQLNLFQINPNLNRLYILSSKILKKLGLKKAELGLMRIDL